MGSNTVVVSANAEFGQCVCQSEKQGKPAQFLKCCPAQSNPLSFMNESGFDCAGQHLRNCAGLPCFSDWQTHCPNSALAETTTVLLPTYPRYEKMEASRLVQKARSYLDNSALFEQVD